MQSDLLKQRDWMRSCTSELEAKARLKSASFQTVKVSVLIATMYTRIAPASLSEVIATLQQLCLVFYLQAISLMVWLDHPCLVLASGIYRGKQYPRLEKESKGPPQMRAFQDRRPPEIAPTIQVD